MDSRNFVFPIRRIPHSRREHAYCHQETHFTHHWGIPHEHPTIRGHNIACGGSWCTLYNPDAEVRVDSSLVSIPRGFALANLYRRNVATVQRSKIVIAIKIPDDTWIFDVNSESGDDNNESLDTHPSAFVFEWREGPCFTRTTTSPNDLSPEIRPDIKYFFTLVNAGAASSFESSPSLRFDVIANETNAEIEIAIQ